MKKKSKKLSDPSKQKKLQYTYLFSQVGEHFLFYPLSNKNSEVSEYIIVCKNKVKIFRVTGENSFFASGLRF